MQNQSSTLSFPRLKAASSARQRARTTRPSIFKNSSKLERNIQEDFAKEGVTGHAKAVLFGNPHRLLPISQRAEFFTDNVLSSAKRTGAALVLTADLFPIVQFLNTCHDVAYAESVRRAIADTSGDIVKFPQIPSVS